VFFVGFILRTNVTTLSDENLESAVRSWEIKPLEVTADSHTLVEAWEVEEPPLL
jgi:hypothetical protein